eukprot:scaffold2718_cov103-Isochrysis_galbana.AAC.3
MGGGAWDRVALRGASRAGAGVGVPVHACQVSSTSTNILFDTALHAYHIIRQPEGQKRWRI